MKKLIWMCSVILAMAFFIGLQQTNKNFVKNLKTENEIIVKDEDMTVLYKGVSEKLPFYLQNKEIEKISICDDTENMLCVFIK